ncbi:hypothetical protein SRB5_68580 [Streptomyces sp. RB5]|uniref:N-acetyltransferase domain-containing protein n=1 Tax=Streptomyces smaragdinus TaxID=2585196 RepID=A0A7K0CT43_9ACTN|nr:hypothetical protein [Streptomyces smaragdinus]
MEFTTGGRLEIRITPADVGKRVSVRRLTGSGVSGERFTDAIGVLTSWDAGVLGLTRRNGEIVRVDEESVVAAKVVPSAPARRRGPAASVRELTRVAARGWPATETAALGGWTLRASGGFTRRANSVLVEGEPGMPLDEALARAQAWYGARGLPVYVQTPTGAPGAEEELVAALDARGWTAQAHTDVQIAALAPVADRPGDGVALARRADDGWYGLYHRAGAVSADAERVLHGGPSVWFATVPGASPGRPAAIGRCVVDGRWAGFAAVETAPEQRRRGLATRVMAALAARALDEGASAAYLQVESDNEGARAMYAGMGFSTHHSYHYRLSPQG